MRRQKHARQSSNLKDNHFIVLSKIFGIHLPEEVHLLTVIYEFIQMKEETEG